MYTKNSYMFPHLSPSSHPRFSGEIPLHLHHHHHDVFPGHYAAALPDSAGGLNGDPSAFTTKASASKKDRHSKIYTSQGPRDRRVRLSIGVARKFFDLQEILGFDKPSKTLDWLLTKSKAAIKDLVQMREKGSTDAAKSGASSPAPSECEVDSGEANAPESKRKLVSDKLKGASKESALASNLAKESRAKARARARERTREKMSIKKLNEGRNNGVGGGGGYHDLNPSIPIQFMNNQLEFRKISGSSSSSSNINLGFHCHEASQNEDLIQESIVIKRKVKHHPSILGFQQNLFISSSNYAVPSPYNAAAENWDICAILDQHKFINSASNN